MIWIIVESVRNKKEFKVFCIIIILELLSKLKIVLWCGIFGISVVFLDGVNFNLDLYLVIKLIVIKWFLVVSLKWIMWEDEFKIS